MIPIRHNWIFRSRWMALLWAAGIIWFAVDSVPAAPVANSADNAGNAVTTDVTGSPVSDQDMDALKKFVGGK